MDTFNKKITVFPIKGENKDDLGAALETAFKRMEGKPEMLYSDAEPGLTSNQTQSWLMRQRHIAHNITLRHAPLAERMVGHIKSQIIHATRGTNKMWWEVVDAVVKDYNENT
ncbi:MAG: transposase family protein [Candidatus Fonsibacter sp.]